MSEWIVNFCAFGIGLFFISIGTLIITVLLSVVISSIEKTIMYLKNKTRRDK
jgi:hypothetical protein